MGSLNLMVVCTSAFVAVFLLLSVLALVMKLIIVVFPQRMAGTDTAVVAALATVVSSVYPNTNITKIEEIK